LRNGSYRQRLVAVLLQMAMLLAVADSTAQTSSTAGVAFESRYLTMRIVPGWRTNAAERPAELQLVKGKYVLAIDPVFGHASGITGGRFDEIIGGMSIDAVMSNVDRPAGGWECAEPEKLTVSMQVSLIILYTDRSKSQSGSACNFPSSGLPVWFGSYSSGEADETEYSITLLYDTSDVNALPLKGSSELVNIFDEVATMLRTLRFKAPIAITSIEPDSAPPGATVTILGSGLDLATDVHFGETEADYVTPKPIIAADGTSLTFRVPPSIEAISGLPIVVNEANVNNCPVPSGAPEGLVRGAPNFCSIATPPGDYQISVIAPGINVPPVALNVTPMSPGPVSISLVYPSYVISPGYTITVIGNGFTPTGNTVRVGASIVDNLTSSDEKTIVFRAPVPAGINPYELSVSNANGQSNPMILEYR
jgi:hypothetical protein